MQPWGSVCQKWMINSAITVQVVNSVIETNFKMTDFMSSCNCRIECNCRIVAIELTMFSVLVTDNNKFKTLMCVFVKFSNKI